MMTPYKGFTPVGTHPNNMSVQADEMVVDLLSKQPMWGEGEDQYHARLCSFLSARLVASLWPAHPGIIDTPPLMERTIVASKREVSNGGLGAVRTFALSAQPTSVVMNCHEEQKTFYLMPRIGGHERALLKYSLAVLCRKFAYTKQGNRKIAEDLQPQEIIVSALLFLLASGAVVVPPETYVNENDAKRQARLGIVFPIRNRRIPGLLSTYSFVKTAESISAEPLHSGHSSTVLSAVMEHVPDGKISLHGLLFPALKEVGGSFVLDESAVLTNNRCSLLRALPTLMVDIVGTCEKLQRMLRFYSHHDLKPDNILLSPTQGESERQLVMYPPTPEEGEQPIRVKLDLSFQPVIMDFSKTVVVPHSDHARHLKYWCVSSPNENVDAVTGDHPAGGHVSCFSDIALLLSIMDSFVTVQLSRNGSDNVGHRDEFATAADTIKRTHKALYGCDMGDRNKEPKGIMKMLTRIQPLWGIPLWLSYATEYPNPGLFPLNKDNYSIVPVLSHNGLRRRETKKKLYLPLPTLSVGLSSNKSTYVQYLLSQENQNNVTRKRRWFEDEYAVVKQILEQLEKHLLHEQKKEEFTQQHTFGVRSGQQFDFLAGLSEEVRSSLGRDGWTIENVNVDFTAFRNSGWKLTKWIARTFELQEPPQSGDSTHGEKTIVFPKRTENEAGKYATDILCTIMETRPTIGMSRGERMALQAKVNELQDSTDDPDVREYYAAFFTTFEARESVLTEWNTQRTKQQAGSRDIIKEIENQEELKAMLKNRKRGRPSTSSETADVEGSSPKRFTTPTVGKT